MEQKNNEQIEELDKDLIDTVKQQWNMLQSIQTTKTILLQQESQISHTTEQEQRFDQNEYEKPIPAPIGIQIDVNALKNNHPLKRVVVSMWA